MWGIWVQGSYQHHKELKAAQGIKITAQVLGSADEVSLCHTVDSLFGVLKRGLCLCMLTLIESTMNT